MRIETYLHGLIYTAPHRFDARRNRQYWAFYTAIMRSYIRLQQENAMLRDEVAFWKAEALKDGEDE